MASYTKSKSNVITYDLFIGNYPPSAVDSSDKVLRGLFDKFGAIVSTELREGTIKNNGSYVGFVRFANIESRDAAACEALSKQFSVDGCQLFIRLPRQKSTEVLKSNSKVQSLLGSVVSIEDFLPQPTAEMNLLVTHVESVCYFWAQFADQETAQIVSTITESIANRQLPRVTGRLEFNQIYGAQFSDDMNWYRCKLLRHVSTDQSEVQYLDYGNTERVVDATVVCLPTEFTKLPAFAQKYWLIPYKPATNISNTRLSEGLLSLQTLRDQIIHCEVYPCTALVPDAVPVVAHNNGVLIGPRMHQQGYLESCTPLELQAMYRTRYNNNTTTTATDLSVATVCGPKCQTVSDMSVAVSKVAMTGVEGRPVDVSADNTNNISRYNTGRGINPPPKLTSPAATAVNTTTGAINRTTGAINTTTGAINRTTGAVNTTTGAVQSASDAVYIELDRTKAENKKLHVEVRQLRDLQQRTTTETQSVRQQVDRLANTCQALEAERSSLQQLCTSLQQNTIDNKLNKLLVELSTVALLRVQFPTDSDVQDGIEVAASLVANDTERLLLGNVKSLDVVETAETTYKARQDDIRRHDVTDAELDKLLKDRDESRVNYSKAVVEFIDVSRQLPLHNKHQLIQSALCGLRDNYSMYMEAPAGSKLLSLQEALEQYRTWKDDKYSLLRSVRSSTDLLRHQLIISLTNIQQRVNLLSTDVNSPIDVSQLIESCVSAINTEINTTNQAQSAGDISVLSRVVQQLVIELQRELHDITRLLTLERYYGEQQETLGHWLSRQPTTTDITLTHRNIKTLRSKLRHKLADREDALEVGDVEEVNKINDDVSLLRRQLHTEFVAEDEQMKDLCSLAVEHFPELVVQFPQLNLSNYIAFSGLVKLGRSLDQFDVQHVGNKSSIHKATFAGQTVLLKEYLLSENVPRDVFLRNVLDYSQITHSNLLPVSAVFFEQRDMKAVLQLPFYGLNLTEAVTEHKLSESAVRCVLRDVLNGLHILHCNGLIHGSIHPNNILISTTGRALLAEYNFTKTPLQRAECYLTSLAGVMFCAPELMSLHVVSPASDLYNFALTALWIFCTDRPVNIDNISDIELPGGLCDVLMRLLDVESSRRPSAEQILRLDYFNLPDTTTPSVDTTTQSVDTTTRSIDTTTQCSVLVETTTAQSVTASHTVNNNNNNIDTQLGCCLLEKQVNNCDHQVESTNDIIGSEHCESGGHLVEAGGHVAQPSSQLDGGHLVEAGGHVAQPSSQLDGGHLVEAGGHVAQPSSQLDGGHVVEAGGHVAQPSSQLDGGHVVEAISDTVSSVSSESGGHLVEPGSDMNNRCEEDFKTRD